MAAGRFITLEGVDGAGKSTHLGWLEAALRVRGKRVVVTREPGGTALGEALRALLLEGRDAMHGETEALLMFAARREHLDKVILPALRRGDWVLSDRFTDASFAYQGGGRGVATEKLDQLEQWVQEGLHPDLTLCFDVPVEIGRGRARAARPADRFEREDDAFFGRVRKAYLERARRFPDRIRVIDAGLPLEDIEIILEEIVSSFCS